MIAIIDYGAGNLFSVKNALDILSIDSIVTNDSSTIEKADRIILPGVGAFADAMKQLHKTGLVSFLKVQASKKPFLGICLGMQMLFQKSYEYGETEGLGLLSGTVEQIKEENVIVPHMGWNRLEKELDSPLLSNETDDYVYFVHSFKAVCNDDVIAAWCQYGGKIPALVQKGNIFGAQFHPEKSGSVGLDMLVKFSKI